MIGVRLITRTSGLLVTLILARILLPHDFGLVAIGVLAVSFMQVFTEMGLKQELIRQSDQISESSLHTVWALEFLKGAAVFVLIWIAAPFVAGFFGEDSATPVIRALGLVPLLGGVASIRLVYLQKELDFRRQFLYEVSQLLGPTAVALPLALVWQNVWALVLGQIAGVFLQTIVSYVLMPYCPKLRINRGDFRRMYRFGKWVSLGAILSYFAMHLDTYAVARMFDSHDVGLYVIAFTISNSPVMELNKALGKVLFPAYAKIAHDRKRVRNAFLRASTLLFAPFVPMCLGLAVVAEDLMTVLFVPEWAEAGDLLRLLSLAALARVVAGPGGGLFYGINKPHLVFYFSGCRFLILAGSLFWFLFLELSLERIALAVLIANSLSCLIFICCVVRVASVDLRGLWNSYAPLLLGGTVMVAGVVGVRLLIEPDIARLLASILAGGAIYGGFVVMWARFFPHSPLGVAMDSLKRASNFRGA